MKLLITGVTGFIGSSMAQSAARRGYDILGVAKSKQPPSCNLRHYVQADLITSDLSTIIEDFSPDVVFHAAGPASVGKSICAPVRDVREAVLSWASILDGIRRSGTDPLVLFPSSAAVYGNPFDFPTPENSLVSPISPYGFHKAACELIGSEYSECFKLNIVILRLFSVLGPRQRRHLIWELYQQLTGQGPTVWLEGTGNESRDYLYIDDAVTAIFELIERRLRLQNDGRHMVINVATGREIRILELANQLRYLVAPKKSVQCRGTPVPGDPERMCADIGLLRSLIPSWNPRPIASALSECVAVWEKEVCSQ